jgi:hypothetical protein
MPNPSHRAPAQLCAIGLAGLALAGCSDDGETKKSDSASAKTTPTTPTGTDTAPKSKKGDTKTETSPADSGSKGAKQRAPKKIHSKVNPSIKIGAHPTVGAKGGKSRGIPASASPFVGVSVRGKSHLSMGETAFGLANSRRTVVVGTVTKKGSRLVLGRLKGAKGSAAKACGSTKGTYSFSASGRRFTLKKIDDHCGARSAIAGQWTNLSRR